MTSIGHLERHEPIGIFDSGIGGLSILRALRTQLPQEDFVYIADNAHAPYGERSDDYVIARSRAIVQRLRGEHSIKLLVIACNTATAAAIDLLRAEHPDLPVVGVEPALKPAAAISRTGRVGVMATRGTLASARFCALQAGICAQAPTRFVLQACDGLADAIERGDQPAVQALCASYTQAMAPFGAQAGQIDTLVLGCTHYPFAQHELTALLGPQVRIIEPGPAVALQTQRLLQAAGQINTEGAGSVRLLSTGAIALRATGCQVSPQRPC